MELDHFNERDRGEWSKISGNGWRGFVLGFSLLLFVILNYSDREKTLSEKKGAKTQILTDYWCCWVYSYVLLVVRNFDWICDRNSFNVNVIWQRNNKMQYSRTFSTLLITFRSCVYILRYNQIYTSRCAAKPHSNHKLNCGRIQFSINNKTE